MIDLQSALFGGIAVLFIQLGVCILYFKSVKAKCMVFIAALEAMDRSGDSIIDGANIAKSISEDIEDLLQAQEGLLKATTANIERLEIIKEESNENA